MEIGSTEGSDILLTKISPFRLPQTTTGTSVITTLGEVYEVLPPEFTTMVSPNWPDAITEIVLNKEKRNNLI